MESLNEIKTSESFLLSCRVWNDHNCVDKEGFICKKLNGTYSPKPTTPSSTVPGYCPKGFFGTGNNRNYSCSYFAYYGTWIVFKVYEQCPQSFILRVSLLI